jgi:hypothetical protein
MEHNPSMEVVENVWEEFVTDFGSDEMIIDQIMIIKDGLLLRSPNLDLLRYKGEEYLIH